MKQKIILSPAALEDADFIADIKTDTELWPYEDDVASADRESVHRKVLERMNSDWYKQYIILLDGPERTPIGTLHMHWYVKERKSWEIGFCIFPEYRKQGYCIEAGRIAFELAFKDWNAHKVVGMCNEHNTASRKAMERLGMTREGTFRQELPWKNGWADQFFYCILESEYGKMRH